MSDMNTVFGVCCSKYSQIWHTNRDIKHEQTAASFIHRLKVIQLKNVLREVHLSTTGLKAQLVDRLSEYVLQKRNTGAIQDLLLFNTICERELNDNSNSSGGTSTASPNRRSYLNPNGTHSNSTSSSSLRGVSQGRKSSYNGNKAEGISALEIDFKPSPFYSIRQKVHDAMLFMSSQFSSQRQSRFQSFFLSPDDSKAILDGKLSVYVLSARYHDAIMKTGSVLLQYPHSIDIKVNGHTVHANTRGLKNKPGTARPADCTAQVKTVLTNHGRSRHNIEVIVGFSKDTSYAIATYLVRQSSIDEIVSTIVSRPSLTKESVIRRIQEENNDEDIEAMSTTHRLKDPVSCGRIKQPIRSSKCHHVDCFDAESFIMLQMQAATWVCTICNKPVDYESLALDEFMLDVLKNTTEDVEEFEVEPNGVWRLPKSASSTKLPQSGAHLADTAGEINGNGIKEEDYDSEEELFKRAQRSQKLRDMADKNMSAQGTSSSPIIIDLSDDDDNEREAAAPTAVTSSTAPVPQTLSSPSNTTTAYSISAQNQSSFRHRDDYDQQQNVYSNQSTQVASSENPYNGSRFQSSEQPPGLMNFELGNSAFSAARDNCRDSASAGINQYQNNHVSRSAPLAPGPQPGPVSGNLFNGSHSSIFGRAASFRPTLPPARTLAGQDPEPEIQLPGGGQTVVLPGISFDLNGNNTNSNSTPEPPTATSEVIDLTLSDDE